MSQILSENYRPPSISNPPGNVSSGDTIVVSLDAEKRILDVNPAGQQLSQRSLDEVRGATFWDRLAIPSEGPILEGIFHAFHTQPFASEFFAWLPLKGGLPRYVTWVLRASRDEGGPPMTLTGRVNVDALTPTVSQGPGTPETPRLVERRASPRRPYRYQQLVAPSIAGAMPPLDAFVPVDCCDISAAGFAFFVDQAPDVKNLIVRLGYPPQVTQLSCRAVYVTEVKQDGRKRYRIGCRFLGRCRPKGKERR
jgi:hypothetical protein